MYMASCLRRGAKSSARNPRTALGRRETRARDERFMECAARSIKCISVPISSSRDRTAAFMAAIPCIGGGSGPITQTAPEGVSIFWLTAEAFSSGPPAAREAFESLKALCSPLSGRHGNWCDERHEARASADLANSESQTRHSPHACRAGVRAGQVLWGTTNRCAQDYLKLCRSNTA